MNDIKEERRQKYTTVGHAIDPNGENIEANCIDIMFVNYGTTIMFVNNYIKIPAPAAGQFTAFTIRGNTGELDRTTYQVSFSAVAGSEASVIWRQYIN